MIKFRTTKVMTALLIIGTMVIAGCQSVTSNTKIIEQDALKSTVCIVEPPPVDENGNPMPVDLIDNLSVEYRAFYAMDSAELEDKYTSELNNIIEFADRCSNLTLFVQGYTSTMEHQTIDDKTLPAKRSSQQLIPVSLAGARAQTIKEYLVNLGLPENRIRTFDCGANNPIASNDTEEGANMNQRVFGWMSARDRYDSMLLNCREIL